VVAGQNGSHGSSALQTHATTRYRTSGAAVFSF
jgi:hypothetical protein